MTVTALAGIVMIGIIFVTLAVGFPIGLSIGLGSAAGMVIIMPQMSSMMVSAQPLMAVRGVRRSWERLVTASFSSRSPRWKRRRRSRSWRSWALRLSASSRMAPSRQGRSSRVLVSVSKRWAKSRARARAAARISSTFMASAAAAHSSRVTAIHSQNSIGHPP